MNPTKTDQILPDYFHTARLIRGFNLQKLFVWLILSELSFDGVSLMLSLAEHVIYSPLLMQLHFTSPIYRGTQYSRLHSELRMPCLKMTISHTA